MVISFSSLLEGWWGEGGQNILFSVPSKELVLRSIGGREGEKGRGKGPGLCSGPRRIICYSSLTVTVGSTIHIVMPRKMGTNIFTAQGCFKGLSNLI